MKYTNKYLASFIDHAVLDPQLTDEQLREKMMIGVKYNCQTICVNPSAISIAKECIQNSQTKLCVVCDFPFGSSLTTAKVAQAMSIIEQGDIFEIDMVMNYGKLKSGHLDDVIEDIQAVSQVCHQNNVGLKVIVETDALNEDEVKKAVYCCIEGHADFIKTSTGYFKGENIVGADPQLIEMMVKEANGRIKVKGSGCVRSRERLIELIEKGIDRAGVGCGSTAKIMEG